MFTTVTLRNRFTEAFPDAVPHVHVRAPGRVNLIGDHTDYNEGFVLPVATEQAVHVLAGPRDGRTLHVVSTAAEPARFTIDLDRLPPPGSTATPVWSRYVLGVAALLTEEGTPLAGANLLIDADLPRGAGLASSAALEVGVALSLTVLAESPLDPRRLADLCRDAEQRYAGTPCGIMDQFACLFSRAGHAMLLDCRSRAIEHVPFPTDELALLVIDTQVRHQLAAGEYAQRVEQCAAAVRHFAARRSGIRSLRDVTAADLAQHGDTLDPIVRNRCRHVIEENQRVLRFVDCLRRRDFTGLGEAMYASHASLRDLYEVSCPELDAAVDALRGQPGVIGARMTGGGFGGCVIACVRPKDISAIEKKLAESHAPLHAAQVRTWTTHPSAGATVTILR